MSDVVFDWVIPGAKSFIVIFMVLNLAAMLLWVERKGSALIQNRIGANRAAIFGILPFNVGFLNTLVADPLKLFTKEDFVPAGADKFVHSIAPFLALFPAVVTMVAVPFGDSVEFEEEQVSMSSPIGLALVGRAVGDTTILKLPAMIRRLKIISLKTIHDT